MPTERRIELKLFIAEYGYFPGSREKSVVVAESREDAFDVIKSDEDRLVDVLPTYAEDVDTYVVISEVPFERGEVYTGYYCC